MEVLNVKRSFTEHVAFSTTGFWVWSVKQFLAPEELSLAFLIFDLADDSPGEKLSSEIFSPGCPITLSWRTG
jgi:hypothetical protein